MIDVAQVLRSVPQSSGFRSVAELQALADSLANGAHGFKVEVAGTSAQGRPIHHLTWGSGSVKTLWVGFPHANEPIGGLTVSGLLELLSERNAELANADVEWHIVPCIDPDGAVLNEGWSLQPFDLGRYMRHFHRQELRDQAECAFPLRYKKLVFEEPTPEAHILRALLTQIRPHLYYSLHNAWTGGAFFALTQDIGDTFSEQLYQLLEDAGISLRASVGSSRPGIREPATVRKLYDRLEQTHAHPEALLQTGACSWEYLSDIEPHAITLLTELPYLAHPADTSEALTTENLRQLKLRLDAENKYLVTALLEEWDRVEADLDRGSPFYRKTLQGIVAQRESLHEGLPSWVSMTRDILYNPAYSRLMTQAERFETYQFDRFYVLCNSYEFVRLLESSRQSPAVTQARQRMDALFDAALADLLEKIDAQRLQLIDSGTLARAQLGSGLVVLNSILSRRGAP